MAFVAGAVVGNLILNTSGFTGGIAGAASAALAGGPTIAAPILAALNLIQETAKKAFDAIVSTIKEVGHEFDDLGETAEKAGVGVEFLSSVGRLAADAGSSTQGLADAMKFLARNAAEAAAGGEEQVKAFRAVGLSQEDVKARLNDLPGLFTAVADGFGGLASKAQETQTAMDLFGRAGTELIPTLHQGSRGDRDWQELMGRLGATVTEENAKAGDAFGKLGSIIDAAWTGLKNQLATPILEGISGNAEELQDLIVSIADAARELIPPVLAVIFEATKAIVDLVRGAVPLVEGFATVLDAVGITNKARRHGGPRRDLAG
jgi:TP901 family phage tail tape measure protein